jgi:hypothetical protein
MQVQAQQAEKPKRSALELEWDGVLFGVKRSIRYHTHRRCFFERLGFVAKFLSVLSGSSTGILAILGKHTTATAIVGFCTAALSSSDLIIGYGAKARLYHDLSRRFIELEREMNMAGKHVTEETLIGIKNKRLTIEADEPPKLRVLDLLCHNEVTIGLGRSEKHKHTIPTWKAVLCHFHDWGIEDCPKSNSMGGSANPTRPESI